MLTENEALAVNFGHEIEHTTDEAIRLDACHASEEEKEKNPDIVSSQLIKEFFMQKPLPKLDPIESKAKLQN